MTAGYAQTPMLPPIPDRKFGQGPSFGPVNRLVRLTWKIVWLVLARWTPNCLNQWRIFLLNLYGAQVSPLAAIAPSVRIWLPANLAIGARSTIGPGVDCYNMAMISIGERSIVSQRTFLCAGTHDIYNPSFPLISRAITIGDDVWIASEAFVAPGVTLAEGCVLGARACAFHDLLPWTVYRGNPAVAYKARMWRITALANSESH